MGRTHFEADALVCFPVSEAIYRIRNCSCAVSLSKLAMDLLQLGNKALTLWHEQQEYIDRLIAECIHRI